MSLKTSNKTAIEFAKYCNDNTFQLLGAEPLAAHNTAIDIAIKNGAITSEDTFFNIFGLNKFFYVIEKVKGKEVVQYEHGIGYLISSPDGVFLKRCTPITHGKNANDKNPCYNGPVEFITNDDEYIIVYSTMPFSFTEALAEDHCVLTSSNPFVPQAIKLEPNSILARLDDEIVSLSIDDFISLIKSKLSS